MCMHACAHARTHAHTNTQPPEPETRPQQHTLQQQKIPKQKKAFLPQFSLGCETT